MCAAGARRVVLFAGDVRLTVGGVLLLSSKYLATKPALFGVEKLPALYSLFPAIAISAREANSDILL